MKHSFLIFAILMVSFFNFANAKETMKPDWLFLYDEYCGEETMVDDGDYCHATMVTSYGDGSFEYEVIDLCGIYGG